MKRLFSIAALSAICVAAMSFVVEIDNIPAQLKGEPLTITSELDGRLLDSITITGPTVRLSGKLDGTEWCKLNYSYPIANGVRTMRNPVFLGNDTAKVTMIDTDKGIVSVSGGSLNAKLGELDAYMKSLMPLDAVKMQKLVDYGVEKINENKSNPFGAFLMSYFSEVIKPQRWLEMYKSLSSNLKAYQPVERAYVQKVAMAGTGKDDLFRDIKGINVDGKAVSLSDYIGKGKYVLVDFWATWCGPCRMEAKATLLPLYEKYKNNKDFMILGVMTSDSVDSHLKGLKSVNYPWTQFIDKDNLAGRIYGFNGIPFIVLFGPDGKVIRRGIRGEEIWKAVAEVLGK